MALQATTPIFTASSLRAKPPMRRAAKRKLLLCAEEVVEKSMTVFPKLEDGTPFVWDYQIRGFFKDTCGALRKVKGTQSEKIKAYKKKLTDLFS